jgi:hypothetical protein
MTDTQQKEITPVQVHNEAIQTPVKTVEVNDEETKKKSEENYTPLGLDKEKKINLLNPLIPAKEDKKSNVGRPTVMTKEVLGKLETAFAYDMTDEEACFYAGINPTSLYDYQKEHKEFTQRKQALKNRPVMMARETLVKSLKDRKIKVLDKQGNLVEIDIIANPELALKYLERKKKDEFSTKTTIDHSGKIDVEDNKVADLLQKILLGENKPKNDKPTENSSNQDHS